MEDDTQLGPADVELLARAADLPLTGDRAALIAPQLSSWLAAANELNRKMSAPAHQAIVPATVFTQPAGEGVEE